MFALGYIASVCVRDPRTAGGGLQERRGNCPRFPNTPFHSFPLLRVRGNVIRLLWRAALTKLDCTRADFLCLLMVMRGIDEREAEFGMQAQDFSAQSAAERLVET